MKVVQVPFCYHPDAVGGTEVYVEALARCLEDQGVESLIVAPAERNAAYEYEGIHVCRFAVRASVDDVRDLYGSGDDGAAEEFGRIVDDERPDVVHLHALTRGASLSVLRQAKRRGIPVVFSYHTPTVSCQRGTLLRWGTTVCDGVLDGCICTACTLHGLGLGKMGSLTISGLPTGIARLAATAGLSGGLWTALRMRELVELRHSVVRACVAEADHIVAVCRWAKDLLVLNGTPAAKITVSPHGLPQQSAAAAATLDPPPRSDGALRIAHLGRLEPIKGTHVLLQALQSLPDANVEIHIFGIVQNAASKTYLEDLKAMVDGDERIVFFPPVAGNRVVSLLKRYDVLAVPSQWLETGPLVVLEAFAAGIPVLGSRLGGIAELVEHQVNGLLVEPGSIADWARALTQLATDWDLLAQLRRGVRQPRRMSQVAEDMLAVYATLATQPVASNSR